LTRLISLANTTQTRYDILKKAIENKNKEKTITKSQCHSSSNTNLYKTDLETILENTTIINTVADSAATGHFFPNRNNKKNSHNIIEVVCANTQTMESVATTQLDIPELSMKAKTAFHFNEMEQPLLSIPLLAHDGCKITLTKDNIVVTKNDKTILKVIRDKNIHPMDDTNQTPQKSEPISTKPTICTTSTCCKQCLPPTNNRKTNGIPQCHHRIPTSQNPM
jgi:hypothetical protein